MTRPQRPTRSGWQNDARPQTRPDRRHPQLRLSSWPSFPPCVSRAHATNLSVGVKRPFLAARTSLTYAAGYGFSSRRFSALCEPNLARAYGRGSRTVARLRCDRHQRQGIPRPAVRHWRDRHRPIPIRLWCGPFRLRPSNICTPWSTASTSSSPRSTWRVGWPNCPPASCR